MKVITLNQITHWADTKNGQPKFREIHFLISKGIRCHFESNTDSNSETKSFFYYGDPKTIHYVKETCKEITELIEDNW